MNRIKRVRGLPKVISLTQGHDPQKIAKLCRSIEKFGFISPVVVDEDNRLLCGRVRVAVAKQLGLVDIPVIRVSDLSESEKRALAIALDRLFERGP